MKRRSYSTTSRRPVYHRNIAVLSGEVLEELVPGLAGHGFCPSDILQFLVEGYCVLHGVKEEDERP